MLENERKQLEEKAAAEAKQREAKQREADALAIRLQQEELVRLREVEAKQARPTGRNERIGMATDDL